MKILSGTVKRHHDGFGFFIPDISSYPDVFLSRKQMKGIMSNDQVKISILPRRGSKNLFSGKVTQIVSRFHEYIVGQYQPLSKTKGLIKDDSAQWGEDFKVQLKTNQTIKKGEWVQARITHWPESTQGLSGYILTSFGFFPSGLEDNIRVIQKYNILATFTSECLEEAKKHLDEITPDMLCDRKDLRKLPFVTIDSETAEDFDDAIYVSQLNDGWLLYVAIADVSYYAPQDSALDKAAFVRGNSTYFPRFVVPMLPERLSNDLCSLKPHQDRLAFVVEMHFNAKGEKGNTTFYPAVINSHRRFNYGQAQEIVEQTKLPTDTPSANVFFAAQLARKIQAQRNKTHYVKIDIPETEVKLDKQGEPVDVIKTRRLFSHQLIEECMLAANRSVAEFLHNKQVSSIYRVHDSPKLPALKFIETFSQNLGINIKLTPPDLHQKISAIMERFSGHSLSAILQTLVLRSLPQALYSTTRKDHFGLNFKDYTHFTSPIRRYSDLVVHRILKAVLFHKTLPYKPAELTSIAMITSACEQRSVKAERYIKDIKKARFLKKYLGAEMEGHICAVTKFGLFVKLKLYDIDGLVHVDQLLGHWVFDEALLQLRSKYSKKRFKIGDFALVRIISSNIDTGQIAFKLKKQ